MNLHVRFSMGLVFQVPVQHGGGGVTAMALTTVKTYALSLAECEIYLLAEAVVTRAAGPWSLAGQLDGHGTEGTLAVRNRMCSGLCGELFEHRSHVKVKRRLPRTRECSVPALLPPASGERGSVLLLQVFLLYWRKVWFFRAVFRICGRRLSEESWTFITPLKPNIGPQFVWSVIANENYVIAWLPRAIAIAVRTSRGEALRASRVITAAAARSRSRSRSTPSAVLEDTMHLVDLLLSTFAPSCIAKGLISMRSILMTIAHPAAQVAGCSGELSAITRSRWELKLRDRVFLQGRVRVIAILFRSVLTAHALFHMNEDPMLVLMIN